jgi:hypothetical protein
MKKPRQSHWVQGIDKLVADPCHHLCLDNKAGMARWPIVKAYSHSPLTDYATNCHCMLITAISCFVCFTLSAAQRK